MKDILIAVVAVLLLAALAVTGQQIFNAGGPAQRWTLVGWNDLGMHCMNGVTYSVASILPPYNTIHAQLMNPAGKLVTDNRGITVTYEAVADTRGSINKSSIGKTDFWTYVSPLFGVYRPLDVGLKGFAMPGPQNVPQKMVFDSGLNWFTAEGIPMTPQDDAGKQNFYPMMRLVARDNAGRELASTRIVLPVSDEMNCSTCHTSDSATGNLVGAMPSPDWVRNADPVRDYKLNFLLLHDNHRFMGDMAPPTQQQIDFYVSTLAKAGFNPAGLYATATGTNPPPILCATCHPSNALPGTGITGVSSLTQAVHKHHADVIDPANPTLTLNDATNRAACYNCHPGSVTKCLRGPMGNSNVQCQDCHGPMARVAGVAPYPARDGWLDVPQCQSCHTGTAVKNSGQIVYTSVFDAAGNIRAAADQTYATQPNTPAPALSMYRFSKGHGGLQCEACHGSTHAEFPSSEANDNVQSITLQGHAGALAECSACHPAQGFATGTGPHGLHDLGQRYAVAHGTSAVKTADCAACHGTDFRGTSLSRALADRVITTRYGMRVFVKGRAIGCYECHAGPTSNKPS